MRKRKEEDSMGSIEVGEDVLWGAQTERSLENFRVGSEKMPLEVVHALALIKKHAALVHQELGKLSKERARLIVEAATEIMEGKCDEEFPLVVWQTGSGTQSHMNVNEVIANIANQKVGNPLGSKTPVHPNDHVNYGQSSNDIFPSAVCIAVVLTVKKKLLPALEMFKESLANKRKDFKNIIKCGRTHMMDAIPITLGQEFSAFEVSIQNAIEVVESSLGHACQLAIGGTAVGTGLNAVPEFSLRMTKALSQETGVSFVSAPNKFEALSTLDSMVEVSSALKGVAIVYMKIANDLRLLSSGPRCGIGEMILPSNEPGSSIMPGKVNPTQCEMMTQVAVQVLGNDVTVSLAATHGHLQLNVFRPVIAYNIMQAIHLLSDAARNFVHKCLEGIEPNYAQIKNHLDHSLMLVTALNPHIGYDKAAEIAKKAHKEGITLKEAGVALEFLTAEQFDLGLIHHKWYSSLKTPMQAKTG